MGVEYFKLAMTCEDDKLSARMSRGREALTAMLSGRLLDDGGQLYMELCFLELLLSEWTPEVEMMEVGRAESAARRSWWQRLWRGQST